MKYKYDKDKISDQNYMFLTSDVLIAFNENNIEINNELFVEGIEAHIEGKLEEFIKKLKPKFGGNEGNGEAGDGMDEPERELEYSSVDVIGKDCKMPHKKPHERELPFIDYSEPDDDFGFDL